MIDVGCKVAVRKCLVSHFWLPTPVLCNDGYSLDKGQDRDGLYSFINLL